jgi:esterase FrsA
MKHIALAIVIFLIAANAIAQSGGPRTLEDLKKETVLRAEKNVFPMTGINPDDAREAIAQVNSLEPDVWANAWMNVAEKYVKRAKSLDGKSPEQAREAYRRAWQTYKMAKWPTENSPQKKLAYQRSLEMFANYARLLVPPIETIRIPFEGNEIVAYLRLPEKIRPAPLVFKISGLDSRKEDAMEEVDQLLKAGIGVFGVDMPGTGQAPIKGDVGAERMFSRALDYLATRGDVDANRIVIQGGSWSGYWAALLAYTERERIRGAVYHSGPVHGYFLPEWQKKALLSLEYLFDLFPARAEVYGVKTMDEFLAYGPRMSLQARGFLGKPSAPMLLLGGENDTQVPIDDLYLLLKSGMAKEAWVNPQGGHMGRAEDWPQPQILSRVVVPWIVRAINGQVPPPTTRK